VRVLFQGTLASLRSIVDYILEEYNQKIGLKIPLEDLLTPETFRRKANEMKNRNASRFIRAYY